MAVLTVQNGVGTLPSSGEDVVVNVLRTGDKGQKGLVQQVKLNQHSQIKKVKYLLVQLMETQMV